LAFAVIQSRWVEADAQLLTGQGVDQLAAFAQGARQDTER